jgi:hypothetical protein
MVDRANTTLILQIEQYKPYTMTTNGKKSKQTHTQWKKNNAQINKQNTITKERKKKRVERSCDVVSTTGKL